jgi:hypothetical protein
VIDVGHWRRWWPNGQAWFWSPGWQAMEREADEAFAAGDYVEFDDIDKALRWLGGESP